MSSHKCQKAKPDTRFRRALRACVSDNSCTCAPKPAPPPPSPPPPTPSPPPAPAPARAPAPTTAPPPQRSGNLAQNQPAKQSSEGWGGAPSRAVDGNAAATYNQNSCTHTKGANSWWRVDLGKTYGIVFSKLSQVTIVHRAKYGTRLQGSKIYSSNSTSATEATKGIACGTSTRATDGAKETIVYHANATLGRYVFVIMVTSYGTICEFEAFGKLLKSVCPAGKSALVANKDVTKCNFCDKGTYALANSTVCNMCAVGRYQIKTGQTSQTSCIPCATGTTTLAVGSQCTDNCAAPVHYSSKDLAHKQPTEQQSTLSGGVSSRAVDSNPDPQFNSKSCSHTNEETAPWWRVDLGKSYRLGQVHVVHRADMGAADRLVGAKVFISDSNSSAIAAKGIACGTLGSLNYHARYKVCMSLEDCTETVTCAKDATVGRYVYVLLPKGGYLSLCHFGAYAALKSACDVAGKYSADVCNTQTEKCKACPAGTISTGPFWTECLPCTQGKFQADAGKTSCKLCPVGETSPASSPLASGCAVCGVGKHYSSTYSADKATLSQICVSCTKGKFQDSTNQSTCKPCTAGTGASGSSATSCSDCSAGKNSMSGVCTDCPIGTAQNATKQSTCKPCAVGSGSSKGAKVCSVCTVGWHANKGKCVKCPPGQFQNNASQTSCNSCAVGTGSDTCPAAMLALKPSACPAAGATSCNTCAVGTYVNNGVCTTCGEASIATTPGQASCKKCLGAGSIANKERSACTQCPTGKFVSVIGSEDGPRGSINLARGKPTLSSTKYLGGVPSRAVDGRICRVDGSRCGRWGSGSCTMTTQGDNEWWMVDLGTDYAISHIRVSHRLDYGQQYLAAGKEDG